MIHNIATANELTAALTAAKAGDTLRLAPGNYGTYTIRDRKFTDEVRIESADAANPAKFNGLTVRGSTNITLDSVHMGRPLNAGEANHTTLNTIRDSSNIKLVDVQIHGSLDDNPQNDGRGLYAVNVQGLLLEGVLFTELHRGIVVENSSNLVMRGSEWKVLRSDGMNIAGVEGVVIANNKFSDFRPVSPDHGDVIQFFNTGQTRGSKNVTIENNHILVTNVGTSGTQGIWISNPLEFGYDNFLIRNNIVYSNTAFHGISVAGGRQIQITNNSVLSQRTDEKDFWIRVVDSDGVVLDRNVADTFIFENVKRFFQGENVNLRLFPSEAGRFTNVNKPESVSDLVRDDVGFQLTAPHESAPVSGALAAGLAGTITPSQSQQAFKPQAIVEPSAENIAPAANLMDTLPLAPTWEQSAPVWSFRDAIMSQHFAIA